MAGPVVSLITLIKFLLSVRDARDLKKRLCVIKAPGVYQALERKHGRLKKWRVSMSVHAGQFSTNFRR